MRYWVRRTRPATGIYTKVSVVPCHPSSLENFHIFDKGLAKKHFHKYVMSDGKNVRLTNIRKSFYKRTTLTGVLHRRIRKEVNFFPFASPNRYSNWIYK